MNIDHVTSAPAAAACAGHIVMSRKDLGAIDSMVHCGMDRDHPVRHLLLEKLRQATVRDPLPADLVTVGARILFHIDIVPEKHIQAPPEMRVLVMPSRYVANGLCLSLTTPLGATLLGMRAGESATYCDLTGRPFSVTVHDVLSQPVSRR